MKKTILSIILLVVISTPLCGQSASFVGLSNDSATGAAGLMAFNQMCRETFGGSQMCNSKQILASGSIITESGAGWVIPNVSAFVDSQGRTIFLDTSGAVTSIPGGLSCGGWSNNTNTAAGLTIHLNDPSGFGGLGSFIRQPCQLELQVACCRVSPSTSD